MYMTKPIIVNIHKCMANTSSHLFEVSLIPRETINFLEQILFMYKHR